MALPFHDIPYHDVLSPPSFTTHALDDSSLNRGASFELQEGHSPQWINVSKMPERIVDIISRYLFINGPGDDFIAKGRRAMLTTVSRFMENGQTVELVFPAFPFKSPSKKKVLSHLPDLGEELLLRRLESLARAIEDYYVPGAVVRIISDGIVYGELLGQSNSIIYQYNSALRQMVDVHGLHHISFVRMTDLLDLSPGMEPSNAALTEEEYLTSIEDMQFRFLSHVVPGFDVEIALKSDIGMLRTYRGYLKFLEADLEDSVVMKDNKGERLSGKAGDRKRRLIAKSMLTNGSKFSDLVCKRFPNAIRLSVHAHNNSGPKYAFDMLPGAEMCASPWHNTVLENTDGTLVFDHLSAFDPFSYEVVHRNGQPYYLRKHCADKDLGEHINPHVTFFPNYPYGLIIKADPNARISFGDLPMDRIRCLSLRYSILLLRGFEQVDRDMFRTKAREMGDIVSWPQFGDILELKENPALDMNSSLTCESMPMHYDGVFKMKKTPSGSMTHDPPNFQVFQCVQAPLNAEGGKTLLTNTAMLFRQGLTCAQRNWLRDSTFSVYTPQNQVFGGTNLELPLIMRNENTGHDVLRWHEDWPQRVTKFKPVHSVINNLSEKDSTRIGNHLTDLLYDRQFCYAHTWATGDFLIADNIELMHTRTAFKPCARELWRIHVN